MGQDIFNKDEWVTLADELALSPRQSEIVYLLLCGKSDKQISKQVGIALPTVRTHFARLFQKFSVGDRSGLILYVFHYFRYKCSSLNCKMIQNHQ